MITLGQGTSVKVTIPTGAPQGANANIDMTSIVGTLSPVLTAPTLAMMLRNTSGESSGSGKNHSFIYRFAVKPDDKVYIYYDEVNKIHQFNGTDFRADAFGEASEVVVRANSKLVGAKYRALEWDQSMDTIGSVLGMYLASWVGVRRVRKQLEVFTKIDAAVKELQLDAKTTYKTATTFEAGAHYIKDPSVTGDDFYNTMAAARNQALTLGLSSAPGGTSNNKYFHTEGIDVVDLCLILSPQVETKLKKQSYFLASLPGFTAFETFGLSAILGVPAYVSAVIPTNWNFAILTTGLQGVYSLEQSGVGIGGTMIIDPDAPTLSWRLQLFDQYTNQILLPNQCWISQSADVV